MKTKALIIAGILCVALAIGCGVYHVQFLQGEATMKAMLDSPEVRLKMAFSSKQERLQGAMMLSQLEMYKNLTLGGGIGFSVLGIVFLVLGLVVVKKEPSQTSA